MLVDVVELRVRGSKRSREEVQNTTPVRGVLQFGAHRPGDANRDQLLASLLKPGTFDYALRPLDWARVTKIDSAGLIVVGLQESGYGRRLEELPQAWWCRPVA